MSLVRRFLSIAAAVALAMSVAAIAVWAFTNTSSIHMTSPSIGVTEATLSSEEYVSAAFAVQSAGALPLQACVELNGCGLFRGPTQVPEGPIQSNDDRMNQTVFASGLLWSGLNTAVSVNGNTQAGIAYFIVQLQLSGSSLKHSIVVNQGYVATSGADVVFPSIGVTSGGNGILTFTLTGPNNFPRTGYTSLSAAGGAGPVTVAFAGASPQGAAVWSLTGPTCAIS